MSRKPGLNRRSLITLAAVALLISGYQYATTGAVSWPRDLLSSATDEVADTVARDNAAWRKATDKVEELGAEREGQTPNFDFYGRVVRVADGDTVSVLDDRGDQHKIRLFGIDSPERDQPYGSRSGNALAERVDGKQVAGRHLIIDLRGARHLTDEDRIQQAFRDCVTACGATLLHIHTHVFEPNGGVSGVAVLAESHISTHTWPERDYAAFDVFMCGDAQPIKAVAILKEAFEAAEVRVTEILRGEGA